jgi:hypothetical protein
MLSTRLLASLVFVAATSAPAFADANGDMNNAMISFMKLRSYHMDMLMGKQTVSADVVNPGRMREVLPEGEAIVIDKTMYMKIGGAWKKYQMTDPLMMSPADYEKKMQARKGEYVVTDAGVRVVGGQPLHAYVVKKTKTGGTDATVFLDSSGRIARMEVGTTVMTVSKFNEPVNIQAPI